MRVVAVAAWACLGIVQGGLCVAADASAPVYKLSIDKQSLDTALTALAQQTGLQIGRFSDAPKLDTPAGPIVGDYTADEALRLLLGNSGLSFKSLNERAFIVLTPRDAKRENDAQSISNCAEQTSGEHDMKDNSGCARRWSYLLAGALGAAAAPSSNAQTPAVTADGLEEVVVTAERRAESLQRTAVSVSVREGSQLRQEGRYTLGQILEDIPGVTGGADAGAAGAGTDAPGTGVKIRGISSNAPLGGSISSVVPATAIYVDDITGGIGGSFDIDRLEVLRGPQGTLYGRSATAGVIAIHTHDPELRKFDGNVLAEGGSYDLQHYSAAINVPMGDSVAVRVSGNHYSRDGFYAKRGGAVETTDGRVKLLYQPSDSLSLLVGVAAQDDDTHSGELNGEVTSPGKMEFQAVPLGSATDKTRQYWAQIDWDLGPAVLTYIPALRTWEQEGQAYTLGGLLLRQTIETPHDYFNTQELRLASDTDSALTWQTGIFYYRNSLRNHNLVESQDAVVADLWSLSYEADLHEKVTTDLGVLGEATYAFSDSTRLTAGVRYDRTKITTDEDYASTVSDTSTFPPSSTLVSLSVTPADSLRRFDNTTYKLRFEHDLTPGNNLLYASVATGFMPGDINVTSGDGGPYVAEFDTETLTAFEIGSKNRFLEERLQVNGGIYHYRYGGFQIGGVNIAPAGSTILELVTLTSPARITGAELEVLFQPVPGDRIGFSVQYSDAKYVDRSADFMAEVAQETIAGIPPVTASLSYDHVFKFPAAQSLEIGFDANYRAAHDVTYLSQQDIADGLKPLVRVEEQVVGNVHATWLFSPRGSLTAYVRNVTDESYVSYASVVPGAGVVGGPPPTNIVAGALYDRRTVGAVVNFGF